MKLESLAVIELTEKFTELAIQNGLISEQSSAEKKAKNVVQFYFTLMSELLATEIPQLYIEPPVVKKFHVDN